MFASINNVWRYINVGMDQLAGYLRQKGFDIQIAYSLRRYSAQEIFDGLDLSCQTYAFSLTTDNYKRSREVMKMIKAANAASIIVAGGGFATRYYREVFSEVPEIDYITLGDGEYPTEYLFSQLKQSWENGSPARVSHPSVLTRDDQSGKVVQINSEVVDMPALDGYEKFYAELNRRKVHCLQSKNNICTGKCTFCTERHGHPVFRDVRVLVNQIKTVHEKFGVTKFFFTDDNILDPNNSAARAHVSDLCDELQRLKCKLAFQCYIKALSIHDTPEDHALLEKMKRTGFIEVFVGIESGNQDDLDLYKKLTTVEENYTVVRMLKQHGLFPIYGFISFNPYSTRERIRKNFQFLLDTGCTHLFNYIFSFVQLNKYTELYERVRADGLLVSDDSVYTNAFYQYKNQDVVELLEYVRNEMVPKFDKIVYHLDWVIYTNMEYCWCYSDLPDYSDELSRYQKDDLDFIERNLSLLFNKFDVVAFKEIADDFWMYFYDREKRLKEIHDTIIGLTEERGGVHD